MYDNFWTKATQRLLKEHPEYRSKDKDKPIETLEVIKIMMCDPVREQYPMFSMKKDLGRLINIIQYENYKFLEYVKRFKYKHDVVNSQVGTEFLDTFVTNQE